MAKKKLSIGALVTLFACVVVVVMFFLPYVVGGLLTETTASGWQFFNGMLNPSESAEISTTLAVMFTDVVNFKVQYNLWAYLIAIFATIAAVLALLVAIMSVMQIIGMKVNDKLSRLLTYVATTCMVVVLLSVIIRLGAVNGDSSIYAMSYGVIASLCALVGASVVKFLKI